MNVLRQSANWGINLGYVGTSWYNSAFNGRTSRSSGIPAAKALTLPGVHLASFHSFLVKKMRWFNSHLELLHRKDHLHTWGRQAKSWKRKCSTTWQSDRVMNLPQGMSWLYFHPHTYSRYGKHEKAELRSKSLNALGNFEAVAAANTGGKTQRFTEMKGFGQPITAGSHYKFKFFWIHLFLPTWFRGNITRVSAGSIFFPLSSRE